MTSADMSQHDLLCKLAVGDCCMDNCRVKNKVKKAFAEGTTLPPAPDAFVKITHSKPGSANCCGVMHLSCFEEVRDAMRQRIQRRCRTMKHNEIDKAMFDESRSGKYDMIRPWCTCACGGLFRVEMDRRGEPLLVVAEGSTAPPTTTPQTDKKKKKKKKNREPPPSPIAYRGDDAVHDDSDDLDLAQYLWKEEVDSAADDDSRADSPREFIRIEDDFVELPTTTAARPQLQPTPPAPPRVVSRPAAPTVAIHSHSGFHIMHVSKDNAHKWKPSLIGRRGCNIQQLEMSYGCTISIENYFGGMRIFLRGGRRHDRTTCSTVIADKIASRF